MSEQPNPNRKNIGSVGFAEEPNIIHVFPDGWNPEAGDMFFVEGCHSCNPRTYRDTGMDAVFCVTSLLPNLKIGVSPTFITSGRYQNLIALPSPGQAIYQPAGEHLKAIQNWWAGQSRHTFEEVSGAQLMAKFNEGDTMALKSKDQAKEELRKLWDDCVALWNAVSGLEQSELQGGPPDFERDLQHAVAKKSYLTADIKYQEALAQFIADYY